MPLAEAMDTLGVRGIDMAEWLGKDATTISRYRDPTYKHGPPPPIIRRLLETEMGLPAGYLDGEVKADLVALRRARQESARARRVEEAQAESESGGVAGAQDEPVQGLEREYGRAMLELSERITRGEPTSCHDAMRLVGRVYEAARAELDRLRTPAGARDASAGGHGRPPQRSAG